MVTTNISAQSWSSSSTPSPYSQKTASLQEVGGILTRPSFSFNSDISTVGWSRNQREAGFGQQDSSVKMRIGELIVGVRLVTRGKFETSYTGSVDVRAEIDHFEAPLIVANAAIITYELLFG